MLDKLSQYERRYEDLSAQMSDPAITKNPGLYQKLARELGDLQELIDAAAKYREAHGLLAEAEEIIADGSEPDLVELAEVERDELQGEVARMEEELKVLLVPKDPNDGRNAIIEIRAWCRGKGLSVSSNSRAGCTACSAYPKPRPRVGFTPRRLQWLCCPKPRAWKWISQRRISRSRSIALVAPAAKVSIRLIQR